MTKMMFLIMMLTCSFAGLLAFAKIRNHIVATLLSLEFASLSVYLYLFILLCNYQTELYLAMAYLALAACEGALGLSILVSIIKLKGNDFTKSSSLAQC